MALVSSHFQKVAIEQPDLPVITKSYEDSFLRPPKEKIGERACVCGDRCLCLVMARIRHGPENTLGFVGTEFLLPAERETFLAGQGLPRNRKKCLPCTRYWLVRCPRCARLVSRLVPRHAQPTKRIPVPLVLCH